jgi:hypothetical protein
MAKKPVLPVLIFIFIVAFSLNTRGQSSSSHDASGDIPSGSGILDVRSFGAKCDGSTDDTGAIQKAIDSVTGAGHPNYALLFPATGHTCIVSQLNLTNIANQIHILGVNGVVGFQSVIACSESAANTGICFDLTGSQYVTLENIRFQWHGNWPLAVIRMGKSTGGGRSNGNSGAITTRLLDIEAHGSYGIYNNGGEVWNSYGDHFDGGTVAAVVLSAGNSAKVESAFAGLPKMPVSMSDMQFYGDVFATVGQDILLDFGRGGSVEDVHIYGGYAQNLQKPFITDLGTGTLRGLTIDGFRLEPQNPAPNYFLKLSQPASRVVINANYAAAAKPSVPAISVGAITASYINLAPGDNSRNYPSTMMSCTSAQSTVIVDYPNGSGAKIANSCPGLVDLSLFGFTPPITDIHGMPACSNSIEGSHAVANDCKSSCAAGTSCSSGGSTHCELYCNGSAWAETGR